jgi:hypothetical protein
LIIMVAFVPMMIPRMREVAIEYFLLIGRQHAANLSEALPEQVMPLMIEISPCLNHFEAGIAQDVADSIALRRRQIELAIHSVDQVALRNAQVVIPVRQGAEGEPDQKARSSDNQAEPYVRLSWQDRSQ